jgi:hypothetical protein
MARLTRFALVASIVFVGSMCLAAVVAAGGAQPSTGSSFTDLSASATIGGNKGAPPDQLSYYVLASRSKQTFTPGGSASSGSGFVTEVNIVQFNSTVNNAGCFIIPSADFKIGEDLDSASLHTTVTAANPVCTGKGGVPVPGGKGAPLAGGAPPPQGTLSLPITLDIIWTGNGVVSTSRNSQSFDCLGYSTDFTDTVRSTFATASGDNSLLPGNFTTPSANLGSDQSRQDLTGILPSTCSGG